MQVFHNIFSMVENKIIKLDRKLVMDNMVLFIKPQILIQIKM